MASSSTISGSTINEGNSQQYPYPSHVNAGSFLSIKLAGKTNYDRWQEQMMCLMESHDMQGFIDGTLKPPKQKDFKGKSDKTTMDTKYKEWKRSDALLKGWIFGSLTEDVMDNVVGLRTANDVWKKLKMTYTPPSTSTISNEDQAKYIPLYRATLKGDWEEVQDIFKNDETALTAKLNDDGETPLHVAIGTCENIQFVEYLLKEINPESLPNLVTFRKANPLHHAAFVGNTVAAKMLVEKHPQLLFLLDDRSCLPMHRAIFGSHTETFLYLLKATNFYYMKLSKENGSYRDPFYGIQSAALLTRVIGAGLLDAAYGMIKKYPHVAREQGRGSIPLKSIAGKLDAYFSGKRYNFYQEFVYSHVPMENLVVFEDVFTENDEEINKRNEIQDIENQKTHKPKDDDKNRRSFFHSEVPVENNLRNTRKIEDNRRTWKTKCGSFFCYVIQRILVKFWEVAVLHVPYVKQLQEEKVKHNKTLVVLKCICKEVGKINSFSEIREHYLEAITLAVEHDNREAVEEIISSFPQAISTKDTNYPLIQLAIINRCENVYNFLVHEVLTNKHSQKVRTDEHGNNLLHLVGHLAPIHKLNLVSGAALQMQRELQWFKEVENFACSWHVKSKNKNQEYPMMVFRREHKGLRAEGEEWMKKTADSYTITAALIITIVFAASITVPGGNDGSTGKAIYATKASFIIFAIADAVSLFTSTTSLLLFLSILTARYAEEDFLYKLPKRLILGLALLFLSVTSMMVAFSATLYLMVGQGKGWILIPIATLTCLPIASFVTLQFPLLVDLVSSTYGQGIFPKQSARKIKQS